MTERIGREEVESRLAELSYPITRADAAAALADVEVEVGRAADEEVAVLGRLVSEVGGDSFDSAEGLAAEVEEAIERHREE